MPEIQVYLRPDGKWSWRLCAASGEVLAADGPDGFQSERDASLMADRIIGGQFNAARKRSGIWEPGAVRGD